MEFKIETKTNMYALQDRFRDFAYNDLRKASRYAINRTLLTLQKLSIEKIRQRLNIKASTLREKHIRLTRATPSDTLLNMYGSISFSTNPIPMLEFVRGSKEVIKQAGIPVRRRRKLRVQVVPGKTTVLKTAFIQKGPKSKQVYVGRREVGFKKRGVRSVGYLVINRNIGTNLQAVGGRRFQDLFLSYLRGQSKAFDGVQKS